MAYVYFLTDVYLWSGVLFKHFQHVYCHYAACMPHNYFKIDYMFFKKCIKIIFSLLHSFHIKGKINMGYCNSDIKGGN